MTPRNAAAMTRPDSAARLDALEARVLALESKPVRAVPVKPAARPAAAEAPRLELVTPPKNYDRDDPRCPAGRSDLPPGFPATGAELAAWREASGLTRKRFAQAIDRTPPALRQQELKGDRPLSLPLALKLVAAVEAGELPSPA